MNKIFPHIIGQSYLGAFDYECFQSIDVDKILIYIIDTVQADVLPLLAEQFDVVGFKGMDYASTDKEKREVIKSAIRLKRYMGTVWAIEEALKTVGYSDPLVVEHVDSWADFAVSIDIGERAFTLDETNKLLRLINYYKNVRSHLKEIRIKKSIEDSIVVDDEFTFPEYNTLTDDVFVSGTIFHNRKIKRDGTWNYNYDTDVLNLTINNV